MPGGRHVDDHLGQGVRGSLAGVAGAHQRQHVMSLSAWLVHILAPLIVHPVSVRVARVRTDPGLTRSRVRSCRCRSRFRRGPWQAERTVALLRGAVAQQAGSDLAVGEPVRGDRRPGGEKLLDDGEAQSSWRRRVLRSRRARSCRSSRGGRVRGRTQANARKASCRIPVSSTPRDSVGDEGAHASTLGGGLRRFGGERFPEQIQLSGRGRNHRNPAKASPERWGLHAGKLSAQFVF